MRYSILFNISEAIECSVHLLSLTAPVISAVYQPC